MTACSEIELASHVFKKATWSGTQETAGSYKIGNPYTVSGVRYYPREDFSLSETGIASWYGPNFHGKRTANGEIYNQNDLTAAHRTLQMPSIVRVTNLENGRSVVVRINDRGPFKRGRVIDVSKRAAELLGFIGNGTARVRVDVLEKESRQIAEAAKRGMNTSRMTPQQVAAVAPARQPMSPVATQVSSSSSRSDGRSDGRTAVLRNDAEALPESLRTPTITVEELTAPGARPSRSWGGQEQPRQPQPAQQPASRGEREDFVRTLGLEQDKTAGTAPMASGHMKDGRFMPDAVVSREEVRPTGIFVQAGSFSVQENAVRLGDRLKSLGDVQVTPVTVSGRQFWRVRVGPIATVNEADRVLDAVIRAGGDGAKMLKN
ncbi:MAG: septal ring lytic transglycosylase RlpA family protein [Alphaproteobacteria bacterium]|nr:septal ring lytic transglycosylase RlpA family protein [Alphaproteobacteria bacterium]